ncbi:MAG TPA: Lrp/AsnC family transcriptional regulator [Nocardioidaceae bacterium]|nr:Lrp/AsnC family transcriptional regulator [Nocardioidaceae bacterium]
MPSKKRALDRVDRALLRALASDARAPGAALAAAVGVAESTVSLRLRNLRRSGLVRGYRADVDLAAMGLSLQAMIAVRLGQHSRKEVDGFRAAAPTWPGVLSMFHTAGADDYLLHVVARDAEDLRDFVLRYLATHPAVQHSETNLIFEHVDGSGWQELVGEER